MTAINPTSNVTAGSQVNPVAPTAPAAPVSGTSQTTAAAAPQAPVPSGAQILAASKVTINGVADAVAKKLSMPSYRPSVGQPPGKENWGGGRGFIDARIRPAAGGWDIEVDTHHGQQGDEVNLFLSARITDPPTEHWVILSVLHSGAMDGAKDDGGGMRLTTKKFFVSLDDINSFFKTKAGTKEDGKTPKLEFRPGDPLSVDAVWQKVGHQCGGRRDATKGYLMTPDLPTGPSIVNIRKPDAAGATPAVTGNASQKPVDLTLKVPDALVTQYSKVLMPGAKMVSRREEELKLEPKTYEELKDFTVRLIALAKLPHKKQAVELEKIFGEKGWEVELTDRYYQRDNKGGYVTYAPGELTWTIKDDKGERTFDFGGLPKVAGMYDKYKDRAGGGYGAFPVASINGAVRFRDGEIKSGENKPTIGKFNLKPGGGAFDPTSLIATRLEYSLDTLPGIADDAAAMAEMEKFLDTAPGPYNPMVEMKKKSYSLGGSVAKDNVLDNDALRYKFTLKHKSGLEVEISNDFTTFTSRTKSIEPAATKGMSQDQKYTHWQSEFQKAGKAFDTNHGAVNKGTFTETSQGGKHRVEIDVEVSVDAGGKRSVNEILRVRGKQVEIEMDHVQAFTTGPVQVGGIPATQQGSNAVNTAEEDKVYKGISNSASLGGLPTIHYLTDLQDPELYADPSYQQMKVAAQKLRGWGFPAGVHRTRQKAAYALEMMGQISPSPLPTLYATLEPYDNKVQVSGSAQKITVSGAGPSTGKGGIIRLAIDEFPMPITVKGTESPKEIAELIKKKLDECVHYTATVAERAHSAYNYSTGRQEQQTVYDVVLTAR